MKKEFGDKGCHSV
jgi:hypothetical protein